MIDSDVTHVAPLGEPLLSLDDLTTWTAVPKSTLYSLLAAGRGPRHAKIGRALRFRAVDVREWHDGLIRGEASA